ncbi:MAG: GMC family oxidoreductase [Pseudodonghicola sp.]
MTSTDSVPEIYDYIVLGGGTAGCALAAQLSRDPKLRVLLLEAGPWDRSPHIRMPTGIREMTRKKMFLWSDLSEPDEELRGRVMEIPHGRVIGGGGSVNYMAHIRGHPNDYARWVEGGAEGWSYDEVLPYFESTEAWSGETDIRRGRTGPIGARPGLMKDPAYDAWFSAVAATGFQRTPDYNGAQPEGFGSLQYSIRGGQRSSTASEMLRPALKRPNLEVVTDALADRLLFDGTHVLGAAYTKNGRRIEVQSRVRTVVCMGAINTPQFLMLSGIGPAEHLKTMGIQPVADLPVGRGLQDHLGIFMMWARKDASHFQKSLRLDRAAIGMLRAMTLRTGPFSCLPGTIVGFAKSKPSAVQPDLQYFLNLAPPTADIWFPGVKKKYDDAMGVRVQLTGQKSRGHVRLASPDPRVRPQITYNSLSHPDDLAAMREGFKHAWNIASARPLTPHRGAALFPTERPKDDKAIDDFIRDTAIQLYHPSCTCQMGDGPDAVLTSDLNVKGVSGLAVVDASAMPNLVSANPNVPITMMAAKIADKWMGRTL